MEKYNMKINYLFNSGFIIETENYILVFDYYMDKSDSGDRGISNGVISGHDLKKDKNIIVFSSHSHDDHYNPVILKWINDNPDICYILSSDIKAVKEMENINILAPYEELEIKEAYIKAYGSTDIGVSFFVRIDGINIFHAGDLNWWYWWDDTEEEIKDAENSFKNEIEKIRGKNIDIAFFPVDPRLEHNYYLGGDYFIRELSPRVFVPMHFGSNFETTDKFADKVNDLDVKVIKLSKRGQEINI